ncbi:MAG: DNRLRE domain-containing protein [Planctomycetota bacterium]
MSGECDFSSGSESVSYTFTGQRDDYTELTKTGLRIEKPTGGTPIARRLSFQQNVGDYTGATDVEVWAIAPDQTLDRQGTLTSDGNNGGGESQVLIRFDRIIGAAAHQVPRSARVTNATLTVVAFDPGTTVYVHRILVPWTAAATWNRLAGGLSVDDREASRVRDGFTFGQINMDRQFVQFDVTQTVQAWIDGAANHGWLFVNTGSNGWDFYSSDWHEKELRPRLDVHFVTSAAGNDRAFGPFERAGQPAGQPADKAKAKAN